LDGEDNFSKAKDDNICEQKFGLTKELQKSINRLEKEIKILQKQFEKATKSNNSQIVQQLEKETESKQKELVELKKQLSEIIDSENQFFNHIEVPPKN
jgi:hypothetical protein